MKCEMCRKKLSPVDTLLGTCDGCEARMCVKDHQQHIGSCEKFLTKKKEQEKQQLKQRLEKEATRQVKIMGI